MSEGVPAILMFLTVCLVLMAGYPVAFSLGGTALAFAWIGSAFGAFDGVFLEALPNRLYGIMTNETLVAVPLFVFMGVTLERARIADELLDTMALLFGRTRGGLAISVTLVGMLLAASTGIVGATVVTMGLLSLPTMLRRGYDPALACGTICASGTLGQIIPPSIILIILGDVLGQPVGDLFHAAIIPGVALVALYVLYIVGFSIARPAQAPPIPFDDDMSRRYLEALRAIVPPLALIIVVLGSIFAGVATPTESSALGGVGALLLAVLYRRCSWRLIQQSAMETVKVTAMVFAILLGATAFSMVFSYTGGDQVVERLLLQLPGEQWGFLIFSMLIILVLGFFIDFVEISFIVVPILAPIAETLGINMLWFAILIAMNLQTSFLTPPFGFSLFYLKGVAPAGVTTLDIYRGVVPFIAMQIAILIVILVFPGLFGLQ